MNGLPKKPWYKTWWGIVICVFVVFLGLSVSSSPAEDTDTTVVAVSDKQAEQPIVAEVPIKELTTVDKLWLAVDSAIKSRKGLEISYNEEAKEVTYTYTSESFWDESRIVKEAYDALVKYGLEVFKQDNVDVLTVKYRTKFTDKYGKAEIEDAVVITFSKTNFEKFDWKGLSYQPIYNQMRDESDFYYVHPAIALKLKLDDLYLSL